MDRVSAAIKDIEDINTYSIGLLCSVYGNFDIETYFERLVKSLCDSITHCDSFPHVKIYVATDTSKNLERLTDVMVNTGAGAYFSYDIVTIRHSEVMSIGYMRSSLIKYLLGQPEDCGVYFFMDADDYVAPQFFNRIIEQCFPESFSKADYFPIVGLNVIPSDEKDLKNYTSILFGRTPIHGSITCAEDLLYQEQLTFALWGYVFTKKCLMYFLDLSGSYEDGVFVERCMDSPYLDYKLIYNIGYVHVNDTPTSLMNVKKMSEIDKRSFRAFLAGIVRYYQDYHYGNALSLLWSQIDYYAKRL